MRINKDLILVFFLLIFGIFGIKALFHSGYFTSHDGWHQVVRLYYYDKAIKEVIFLPSYITGLYYGYGYPLFIFSYHLPWILAEPFMLAGLSVFNSIKAVYIITYIASGLTMFLYLRNRFKSLESFIGAFIYIWAPYRFSNIFVRGSVGEATVFVFIPLLFLGIDLSRKHFKWSTIMIGSLAISGIILSHAIVALLVLGAAFLYFIIQLIFEKNKLRFLSIFTVILTLGIMLSSYYLIPAISYKKYTQFNERFQLKYDGQFATISELIYSKWGYGFSTPRKPDSMSFQVGIAQWLTIILVVSLLFFYLIKKRKIKQLEFACGLILIFTLAVFLILPKSSFVWAFLAQNFFSIDFPWRLLTIAVFSSSALGTYLLFLLPKKLKLIFLLLLIGIALYTNRNHLRVNQYTNIPLDLYLLSERTTNTYDEYLPKWADGQEIEKMKKGGTIEVKNDIEIVDIKSKMNRLSFNYKSSKIPEFTVHLSYFPGWEVSIDNAKTDLSYNDQGLMKFQGLGGEHKVLINYRGTILMQIAKIISLITLLLLTFGFFIQKKIR